MAKHKVYKRPKGITVVVLDGPLVCLRPIPRGDLDYGCSVWTYPYMWDSVTYELDRIEEGIHYYRWKEGNDEVPGSA